MNLGYESGDQVGAFDEKKEKKISCECTSWGRMLSSGKVVFYGLGTPVLL
jgi:hypothetical protein